MFAKVLIANRGEIAVRVARTCRALSVSSVAVYSDADAGARHVVEADEAVHLPGVAPADTYLRMEAIIAAARRCGAEAVHPGYGFLSEDAGFAEAVVGAGLTWVGPGPAAMRGVGDKISARRLAESAGVPIVPGLTDPVADAEAVRAFGELAGYPLAIKASGGGGGRGLKVVHDPRDVEEAFETARREARSYFGSEDVYVERYLDAPKHLEVQLLAPTPDQALWLGARDCSLQRRHQKLIEETPPSLNVGIVTAMGESAVALSKACGYVNAGTVEFLVDSAGNFFFLEVNARLQVEHTVTEEAFGLDLVACQLKIAAGDPLGFSQADLEPGGHAIECRVNAEDPAREFAPTPGVLTRYAEPRAAGVRVDSGYREGDEVPDAYDSLLAKVVVHALNRAQARTAMIGALRAFEIQGVSTTIPAHLLLLEEPSFVAGEHTTRTVEDSHVLDALTAPSKIEEGVLLVEGRQVHLWNRAMAASARAAYHRSSASGEVIAPMQGTVLKVLVEPGQEVSPGDPVVVLEAMKMETTIAAPRAGVVAKLTASEGEAASAGQILAVIE